MVWYNNPHDLSTFTPAWAFLVRRSGRFIAKFLIDFPALANLDLPDGAFLPVFPSGRIAARVLTISWRRCWSVSSRSMC